MRHIAVALITCALITASAIGDMGYMSDLDGRAWDFVAMAMLVYFLFMKEKSNG